MTGSATAMTGAVIAEVAGHNGRRGRGRGRERARERERERERGKSGRERVRG